MPHHPHRSETGATGMLETREVGMLETGAEEPSHPQIKTTARPACRPCRRDVLKSVTPGGYPGIISDYMPMPPGIAGAAGFFSLISLTIASVVSKRAATEAAFCSATRSTFAGTITPILSRSPYSAVRAL